MVDFEEFMLSWSFFPLVIHSIQLLRKLLAMALRTDSLSSPPWMSFRSSPVRGVLCLTKEENLVFPVPEILNIPSKDAREEVKLSTKPRKRPARLVIPDSSMGCSFGGGDSKNLGEKEIEFEGSGFCVASKKGRREVLEDAYEVKTNISGDSKQAFFGVFDGHGGRGAVDFVSEKLGDNILTAISEFENEENHLELATKSGYLTTDTEFLRKGISSGACAATVLAKDGELLVANVGDCRVVLSRNGVAEALTCDQRVEREDERFRIENSGGYVYCHNGVWRVQGSLAIARAIGDLHLKEWIISEPETKKLQITLDCQFLIMASDGLWDKVTNQEAVDMVLSHKKSIEACKKLVNISSSRGNKDDITILVVDLKKFIQRSG